MRRSPQVSTVRRIVDEFPSYREFVDAALFDPLWGYYSTGRVRFGDAGHYETYPDAMSPLFGEMIAGYAFKVWKRLGEPPVFEVAEIGAGNGQLCIDVVAQVVRRASRAQPWRRFAEAFHYRILERSPALIERQRQQLRGADDRVVWTRCDLSTSRPRRLPFAPAGLIIANEVLDCLAHQKVVANPGEAPNAVFVVPTVAAGIRARTVDLPGVQGAALTRSEFDEFMADPELSEAVRFEERQVPVSAIPGLETHLHAYCPELFAEGFVFPPYFACPQVEAMMRNSAGLYDHAEALWIDYGHERRFHIEAPEEDRVFAGPPGSERSPYDAPGWDDITFMVDFTTAAGAARAAGWEVVDLSPQADLARRAGVDLDQKARERIVAQRGLKFLLSLTGVDPERVWRRGAVTWRRGRRRGRTVRDDAQRVIDEFLGKPRSNFKLLSLRR